jgi:hypothetical protein
MHACGDNANCSGNWAYKTWQLFPILFQEMHLSFIPIPKSTHPNVHLNSLYCMYKQWANILYMYVFKYSISLDEWERWSILWMIPWQIREMNSTSRDRTLQSFPPPSLPSLQAKSVPNTPRESQPGRILKKGQCHEMVCQLWPLVISLGLNN